MLVFLYLMLEPEMGCGYGRVSHFGILSSVHLQGNSQGYRCMVHSMHMKMCHHAPAKVSTCERWSRQCESPGSE